MQLLPIVKKRKEEAIDKINKNLMDIQEKWINSVASVKELLDLSINKNINDNIINKIKMTLIGRHKMKIIIKLDKGEPKPTNVDKNSVLIFTNNNIIKSYKIG